MRNKKIMFAILMAILCTSLHPILSQETIVEVVAPGVLKLTYGMIDKHTPYSFCSNKPAIEALKNLPEAALPFSTTEIEIKLTNRGIVVALPLSEEEQLYGFGLQMNSFNQKGLKKKPIVNDYPLKDLGYTHAPASYYVSTKGYGVLINTSRYTTFYCGNLDKKSDASTNNLTSNLAIAATTTDELYKNNEKASNSVTIDIPKANGIEVYIFLGPDMRNAVQRYNLFSGGGAMPAIWGLGMKYRVKSDFTQADVTKMAGYFRSNQIPCDVIGLEPRWQTAAYSCSYVWNNDFYPQPQNLIDTMKSMHFRLNLWEHAFVSQKSPLYKPLKNLSGDYLVWKGLVPDFADSTTRKIFGTYHKETFVNQGISGFKLDECDNSDITRGDSNWSFPEITQFPSGIDGEQMHQMYGLLYLKSLYNIYKEKNQRVFFDVRSSGAFAAPYAAALYSDTYDHKEYIRMIANSGFSGLNWSPEVRESNSTTELIRRTQTAILSAQTLFNSWYLQNPPWLQYDTDKNNKGILLENAKEVEGLIRKLLNFRMSLVPYLYSAFAQYNQLGIPPFRALIMDYPNDKNVYNVFDEYMVGESLLATPLVGESPIRKVYLPAGNWYNFNTNEKYEGGKEYMVTFELNEIPLFVKEGSILPLAKPVTYISSDIRFDITCYVYGQEKAETTLFEDDGVTYNFENNSYNTIKLSYNLGKGNVKRTGSYKKKMYLINDWNLVK